MFLHGTYDGSFLAKKMFLVHLPSLLTIKKLAVIQDPWVQVRDLRTGKVKITISTPGRILHEKSPSVPQEDGLQSEDDWGDICILDIKNPKETSEEFSTKKPAFTIKYTFQ